MIELRNFVQNIRPYKPGKPIEEVVRELGITEDVLKLASNENPLGPSPKALEVLKSIISDVNLYPDDNCYYLKKRMSEKYGVSTDRMIIGSGSVELIELIFKAYVNPGDEIIMSEPSFIMYRLHAKFSAETASLSRCEITHTISLKLQRQSPAEQRLLLLTIRLIQLVQSSITKNLKC